MAERNVDVEQVIDDVLEAERQADDVIDDAGPQGDVAEADEAATVAEAAEADACGALDGLPRRACHGSRR